MYKRWESVIKIGLKKEYIYNMYVYNIKQYFNLDYTYLILYVY